MKNLFKTTGLLLMSVFVLFSITSCNSNIKNSEDIPNSISSAPNHSSKPSELETTIAPTSPTDESKTVSSSDIKVSYDVTFNSEGGSQVQNITVNAGESISAPNNPTRDGCVFKGWYTSYDYTTEFNFDSKITSNVTLYAKWILNETKSGNMVMDYLGYKVYSNGVKFDYYVENKTGIDVFYLENVILECKDKNTGKLCVQSSFGNIMADGYFRNNVPLPNSSFFAPSDTCDMTYWQQTESFSFVLYVSYNAVVLPNELK